MSFHENGTNGKNGIYDSHKSHDSYKSHRQAAMKEGWQHQHREG